MSVLSLAILGLGLTQTSYPAPRRLEFVVFGAPLSLLFVAGTFFSLFLLVAPVIRRRQRP
jgi:hypothetical protein